MLSRYVAADVSNRFIFPQIPSRSRLTGRIVKLFLQLLFMFRHNIIVSILMFSLLNYDSRSANFRVTKIIKIKQNPQLLDRSVPYHHHQ